MSSREAFEKGPGAALSLAKRSNGTYISVIADIAWESWQAATNRAANFCETPIGRKLATIQSGPDQLSALIREGNE